MPAPSESQTRDPADLIIPLENTKNETADKAAAGTNQSHVLAQNQPFASS